MQHFFDYSNQVAIYAIYAVSLNVLLGYAGQLSIAHAAFGAIGYRMLRLGDNAWEASALPSATIASRPAELAASASA